MTSYANILSYRDCLISNLAVNKSIIKLGKMKEVIFFIISMFQAFHFWLPKPIVGAGKQLKLCKQ